MTAVVMVAMVTLGGMALAGPAGAAVAGPTVTLTSNANPSVAGQLVTLKAVVSDPAVPKSLTAGTMTFLDGATVLGTKTVTSGVASLATRSLTVGDHAIVASYTATGGSQATDSAPLAQRVDPADTTTTIVSSKPSATYFNTGKITATVKAVAPGSGVPTGSVDFYVDGGWYWTAYLDATGKATMALTDLFPSYGPGTYSITATYTGDGSYNPSSTATPVAQTLVGITSPPVSTATLDANGAPAFSPKTFTLSSYNPVGCNVTITNNTPYSLALTYGTPGSWKRLPFGVIAPGASLGVGVGLSNFTGYFSAMGASNYVTIKCV